MRFTAFDRVARSPLCSLRLRSTDHLFRANLEDGWAGSDGVVGDGGVATSENNVGLTADGSTALGAHWDRDGKAAGDGSGTIFHISQL